MKKFIKNVFTFILKLPIYFYKVAVSPLLPKNCKFYPTCSSYCLDAISSFGLKGIGLGIKRISKCNPVSDEYGYDPIPMNIKGEEKWLL